jgi:hypothetical protein
MIIATKSVITVVKLYNHVIRLLRLCIYNDVADEYGILNVASIWYIDHCCLRYVTLDYDLPRYY